MNESQSPQDGRFAAPAGATQAGATQVGAAQTDATQTGAAQTGGEGKVDATKHEAAEVASTAGQAAEGVMETAKTEAANVAQDVQLNAQKLYHQTRSELYEQAETQQQRVADGLRALSAELSTMASASDQHGVAADLVNEAAQRSASVADWLGNRDPGSVLDEVKSFARRRPGAFLLLAAGAGVVAGRLGRGLAGGPEPAATTARRPQAPAPVTEDGRPGEFGIEGSDPDMASGAYRPAAGTAVPLPPVDLPGPDATTAGVSRPAGPAKVQGDPFDGYDGGPDPDSDPERNVPGLDRPRSDDSDRTDPNWGAFGGNR